MNALWGRLQGGNEIWDIGKNGKQRGLKVEDVYYDEIPKEMLMLVVEDGDVKKVTDIIIKFSRTSDEGSFGDGKIFILPVEKAITVSSGKSEL